MMVDKLDEKLAEGQAAARTAARERELKELYERARDAHLSSVRETMVCVHGIELGFECDRCGCVVGGTGPAVEPGQVWRARGDQTFHVVLIEPDDEQAVPWVIAARVLHDGAELVTFEASSWHDEYWYTGERQIVTLTFRSDEFGSTLKRDVLETVPSTDLQQALKITEDLRRAIDEANKIRREEQDAFKNANHFVALGWAQVATWLRTEEGERALKGHMVITPDAREKLARVIESRVGGK
jgi:hypothetical protein